MSTFKGFPPEAINFLRDLGDNNNKPWFEEHRQTFQNELLGPAVAFITAVGEALQAENPDINYDTRTNGSGSLMRIYRDTRFSKDKTPYKTNISGMWWEGAGKKTQSPGFGFQMSADGMGLMGGMFGFDKEQLERYRQAVADDKKGAALEKIVADLLVDGEYELLGDRYKKVPRGFEADHPRAELLKYKGLWAHPKTQFPPADVQKPSLVDRTLAAFAKMRPLQRWLVETMTN